MINQRINWCLTFYQRKCPHLTMMKRIYLFPQILNVIDIKIAEANCLDCKKHIDRRALSTKSILEGRPSMGEERRCLLKSRKANMWEPYSNCLAMWSLQEALFGRLEGEYDMPAADGDFLEYPRLVVLEYTLCHCYVSGNFQNLMFMRYGWTLLQAFRRFIRKCE